MLRSVVREVMWGRGGWSHRPSPSPRAANRTARDIAPGHLEPSAGDVRICFRPVYDGTSRRCVKVCSGDAELVRADEATPAGRASRRPGKRLVGAPRGARGGSTEVVPPHVEADPVGPAESATDALRRQHSYPAPGRSPEPGGAIRSTVRSSGHGGSGIATGRGWHVGGGRAGSTSTRSRPDLLRGAYTTMEISSPSTVTS